jgi:hypothetical protein
MDIQELLARRSDLSTFLVHLTREFPDGTPAKANLKSIIHDRVIEARNPYGIALSNLRNLNAKTVANLDSQKVVCFTETPLEHIRLLTEDIQGRKYKFGPYGIAIAKRVARLCDVNPIWYLDITPSHDWLTKPLNKLIDAEINNDTFATSHLAKLTPFIETMGKGVGKEGPYFKEYWWEREWRHAGDFSLSMKFIVICPEEDYGEVTDSLSLTTPFIDPCWSLEQIIGRLAGFKADDIDPF